MFPCYSTLVSFHVHLSAVTIAIERCVTACYSRSQEDELCLSEIKNRTIPGVAFTARKVESERRECLEKHRYKID